MAVAVREPAAPVEASDETVLDRAMNALALNSRQAREGFDPSPEIDSGIETNRLARASVDAVLAEDRSLSGLTRRRLTVAVAAMERTDRHLGAMIELNGRERQQERQIARQSARPSPQQVQRSNGEVARCIGGALDVITDPDADPMAYVRAGRDLGALFARVPESTLRGASMRKALGDEQHRALLGLLGEGAR